MKKLLHGAALLGTALALSACLVPEQFQASATFKPDGSYTYKYDGTAFHALAAMAIKDQGSLSAKDEASLQRDAEKSSKADGVKKLRYMGAGKYEISIERDMKPGQAASIVNVIVVRKAKDGVLSLSSPDLKQKDKDEFKRMGIKIAGMVEVTLPANATVLSHNATKTPGIFSKAYQWKVGALDEKPALTFRLAAP